MDWAAILKKAIEKKRYTKAKAIEAVNVMYLSEQISADEYNSLIALIETTYTEE